MGIRFKLFVYAPAMGSLIVGVLFSGLIYVETDDWEWAALILLLTGSFALYAHHFISKTLKP